MSLASLLASIIIALEVAMASLCAVAIVCLVVVLRRAHRELPLWQPRRGRRALTERQVRAIGYAVFPAELEAPGEPLEGVVLGADQAARVFRSRPVQR